MSVPTADTEVSYPDGDVVGTGRVVHVATLADGAHAVVLDRTAIHPVDTAWPDQPADRGRLRAADGREWAVTDAVTAAARDGVLLRGADVPVRTGTEGWTFVVAHLVEGDPPAEGEQLATEADAAYRAALSSGHTACHLASLALDAALADAWRKDAPADALGSPAFDALAIQSSRIVEHGSRDVYRIGKSLRRRGFDPAAFDDPDAVAARANEALAAWVAAGGAVRIERDGRGLSDRRAWVCELPPGEVRIPCGGTHVESLAAFAAVTVALAVSPVEGGLEVVMHTTSVLR